jgi:hypothetical protein
MLVIDRSAYEVSRTYIRQKACARYIELEQAICELDVLSVVCNCHDIAA